MFGKELLDLSKDITRIVEKEAKKMIDTKKNYDDSLQREDVLCCLNGYSSQKRIAGRKNETSLCYFSPETMIYLQK